MKTLRKIVKLLPPAFAMRKWLARKYGIDVKPSPWGGAARVLLEILPYAFTAALSVREDSDSRLLKYFLPYGKMSKFVRMAYGFQRGDASRDHGAAGVLRSLMPYGLVLWWDAEDERIKGVHESKKQPNPATPSSRPVFPCRCISEAERQTLRRLDRIEAMTLRSLLVAQDRPA